MKDNLILRWIEFFIKNSRNTFPIINSSFFRIKPKNRVIKFSQYFFLTSSFFLFAGANYTSFLKVLRYKKYLQITSKAAYLALPTYFHGSPRKF
jgi:hypothetical protein